MLNSTIHHLSIDMKDNCEGVKERPKYILVVNIHLPPGLLSDDRTQFGTVKKLNDNLGSNAVFRDSGDRSLKHVVR